MRAQSTSLWPERLQVTIIGAGATGMELAAELQHTTYSLVSYGPERIAPERDIHIELIEAGLRILGTSATRCRPLGHRACTPRLTARRRVR